MYESFRMSKDAKFTNFNYLSSSLKCLKTQCLYSSDCHLKAEPGQNWQLKSFEVRSGLILLDEA